MSDIDINKNTDSKSHSNPELSKLLKKISDLSSKIIQLEDNYSKLDTRLSRLDFRIRNIESDFIERYYLQYLLRKPSKGNLEWYFMQLESSETKLDAIPKTIISSDEYLRVQSVEKVGNDYIITQDGLKMFLNRNDNIVSGDLAMKKIWEPFETKIIKYFINKNTNFIDIGAHIGYYSLLVASIANSGKIISFEPEPENYQILQKNIYLNQFTNIIPIQKALSDKNGEIKLYLSTERNSGDNRSYSDELQQIQESQPSVIVKSTSLDDYIQENSISPDIIKIDVQGFEDFVLNGMLKTIHENQNLVLLTEFWPKAISSSQGSPENFLKLLKENEFEIYELIDSDETLKQNSIEYLIQHYSKDPHPYAQTNLLCLKNVNLPKELTLS